MKEGDCYDAWKVVVRHCKNEISQITGIIFDQYHSLVVHAVSYRINIDIAAMHRITAMILDVSNLF